ncbi:hypothetical protein RSG63_004214 [Yersinia enterocolitica]|uniref:hypothetical protein n=1 Tax=Yersinia TaxID=629 RepID=UPI0005E9CAAF|nr:MULTISPECIES: hypothetical protein [Yersinia]EKN3779749.1 hypothetical protein [Yersinia enterocolitica]ELI8374838.1 hypothetical protein [Yersinia enterocolitica]UYJ99141.1 hypothetical protein N4W06_08865 [Yersinia enterocolitica]CNH98861.1 Uncharacterised protein [Yersinia intermedia]HDL6954885.1 hypothetical protein [Yersinia enterocolitica]
MFRTQDLFIDSSHIKKLPEDEKKSISGSALATRECFVDGFKAIGNLMFWACDNEKYPDSDIRGDMAIIGLLLTRSSEIIEGLIEVEQVTEYYSKK